MMALIRKTYCSLEAGGGGGGRAFKKGELKALAACKAPGAGLKRKATSMKPARQATETVLASSQP